MSGTGSRHGFDDDEETRRLLRSPPAPAALAWVRACVGSEVARWDVLQGGMSSAMYVVSMNDAASGQPPTRLVLRCYVRPEINEEEPDLAARESVALQVAARAEVPTPALVAVDPDGKHVGVPALLMTRLPGRLVWDPDPGDVDAWLRRLAGTLPAIHAADPGTERLGAYANYRQESYEPPAWATRPRVWERAVELFQGPVLDDDRCFIHRDYHPGNVLWQGGRVSGVVDWQSACVGPASVDVGHCRANLLRYAPELTDPFTRYAEEALGRPFHPWADIGALIGMLDHLRLHPPPPRCRDAIEAAIDRAVVELSARWR